MRFIILIALCITLAAATNINKNNQNKNRVNRLLRNLQRQQQQQQQQQKGVYGYEDDEDSDNQLDDEDDEEDYYQKQQQCPGDKKKGKGAWSSEDEDDEDDDQEGGQYGGGGDDSDEVDDQEDQDSDEQDQYGGIKKNKGQQQQQKWQKSLTQQQQQELKHQCKAKPQLLKSLENPNGKLAGKLYKQAKEENDDKNTVVSPAALQLALAALQKGARGNTKRQLQRITGAGLNQVQCQQAHAALKKVLQGKGGNQQQQIGGGAGQGQQKGQVKATTTIVIKQQSKAQLQFVKTVQICMNAQVKKCNFQQQPKQCRQQLNQLISQKTNQKLKQVVPDEAITSNTKMVVVSTAQLKAKWGKQFQNRQTTKQGPFYPLGSQQPKTVKVLQSQGQFKYYEDQQVQVVGVPTEKQELTLYVIVPKQKHGLNKVEKQQIQDGQQLKELLNNADQVKKHVQIELPKFQIKHKIDAKQTLRQQGASAPFDPDQADFSGIDGQKNQQKWGQQDEDDEQDKYDQDQDQDVQGQQQKKGQQLHLNKLIHQATIKVNEQGISAAQQNQHDQGGKGKGPYGIDDDEDDQNDDENEDDDDQQQKWENDEYVEQMFGQKQKWQKQQQQQQQYSGIGGGLKKKVKANHAFAFAVKHNPSNQIVMVGRVVDASQKPQGKQQGGGQSQSLNGVDQQ